MPKLRCAIYTRKSSEEGLEQEFNSLHAQREACEAYILSQAGEGWSARKDVYDDGGFSGGSMERPGLKRLLADIAAGLIDIVVVYKVDRLTRSLTDFSRIVESFDARGVSFVSVTQAFNTTTSMGRLTLNVLLSFAQFEREVTGERIRDKIAASKAKGMWMGGMVPLGYDVRDRRLVINESEAATVRRIFQRYLDLRSVDALARELYADGVRSKVWTSASGRILGGARIGKGSLLHILQSRLYLGEIVHKGQAHTGLHDAIVSTEIFELAKAQLGERAAPAASAWRVLALGFLVGRLFDEAGQRLVPSFAYGRKRRVYRYYVSRDLLEGFGDRGRPSTAHRVSAPAIESFLAGLVGRLVGRRGYLASDLPHAIRRVDLRQEQTQIVLNADHLFRGEHPDLALRALRGRLGPDEVAVLEDGDRSAIRVLLPQRLQLRGGRTSIVGTAATAQCTPSPELIALLRRAHQEARALSASPFSSPRELANASSAPTLYRRQLARLSYLAPELQRQILEGRQPRAITAQLLLETPFPLAWADQVRWLQGL